VIRQGESRREIARSLNAAYADGLLSEETFVARIEHLLAKRVIDPMALIGDLSFRTRRGWSSWKARVLTAVAVWPSAKRAEPELLLALDWTGAERELLIGRGHGCDVVLTGPSVSRRHARLLFRDGNWILRDLGSTNGTAVNGAVVGRCVLRPGDQLMLGAERLRVD